LSYQLIFEKKYISQKGKNKGQEVTSEDTWYYPTLAGALKGYVNRVANVEMEITDLMSQLLFLEGKIEKLVKDELRK
jgi:hypothetical protein